MAAEQEQIFGLGPVALILIGVLIGLVPPWLARKQRLRTHWAAIRAEINECNKKAHEHRNANPQVMAPLYRLPTIAFETSFPILLGDAAISEDDITTISDFYDMVQQLNRGLEAAASEPNDTKVIAHHKRNKLKVGHIIDPEGNKPSRYDRAISVVDRKIRGRWWRYDPNA